MSILDPITDRAYLYDLAAADGEKEGLSRETVIDAIDKYYFAGWYWLINGERKAAAVILLIDGKYILEAFKDQKAGLTGMRLSVEAGEQVLDYMEEVTPVIYAYARAKDNGIQRLITKLKFKFDSVLPTTHGDIFVYKKEMS